jgi:hypothetical protein
MIMSYVCLSETQLAEQGIEHFSVEVFKLLVEEVRT